MLLMWGERLPRGRGFRLHVRPAPPLPPRGDSDEAWQLACATQVNRAMESLIAECPSQYLWGYHRYKAPRRASRDAAREAVAASATAGAGDAPGAQEARTPGARTGGAG